MRNSHVRKKNKNLRFFAAAAIFIALATFVIGELRMSKWDGSSRFTVAINSNPITVLSLEPDNRHAVVFFIPENLLLDTPYDYGYYPASSVYKLGLLDKKRDADKILGGSIENTFGIVVESVMTLRSEQRPILFTSPFDNSQIETIKGRYFSFSALVLSLPNFIKINSELKSNLNTLDYLKIWNAIRVLRPDQIEVLDIDEKQVYTEEKQLDGNTYLKANKDTLDAYFSGRFQDQNIRTENINIEVINAANQEGLVTGFTRILTNIGANVIKRTTADTFVKDRCVIYVSDDKVIKSNIIKKLKDSYGCIIKKEVRSKGLADLQIVLGTDFLK